MKNNCIALVILLTLSALAVSSLVQAPFFITVHDQVQPERISEMARAVLDGQIPPRYVGNLGYGFGYPLFNFYAPLAYYFGALVYLSGFSLIASTKIMVILGFITAGVSMYYAACGIWSKKASLVAAILYLLAPYHAVQVYVRGSVGELYAYALLPLILRAVLSMYSHKTERKTLVLGASALVLVALEPYVEQA
jgi:hypothetical protein